MDKTKIKIISNPYKPQKRTTFKVYDKKSGCWSDITRASAYYHNSALLKESISETFFPFSVENILTILVTEFASANKPIDLEFAGSNEDFLALSNVCQQSQFAEEFTLSRSSEYLPNARDILPQIVGDFQSLRPTLDAYLGHGDQDSLHTYNNRIQKFEEASSKTIPICVIGPYSSGKSTFINSLIGHEILPSSDDPCTTRVCKLSRSSLPDYASVSFTYDQNPITISFTGNHYSFQPSSTNNPLIAELSALLESSQSQSLFQQLNLVLEVINRSPNLGGHQDISDLIALTVPFSPSGFLGEMQQDFLIIDTPGPNNSSDIRHKQCLNEALEGLSDGLPILVCENSSKVTTDFVNLYQMVACIPQLDKRFTMLLINKADAANLSGKMREPSSTIKRSGVYYLSSIMGLGFKTQGTFFDSHIEELFFTNKEKYVNPRDRYYRQLYAYNILPPQIKREFDDIAAKNSSEQSLLYANSGLLHVELAIAHFADYYSPYNKCFLCYKSLLDMIEDGEKQIQICQGRKEDLLATEKDKFEKKKSDLESQLKQYKAIHIGSFKNELYSHLSAEMNCFLDDNQTDKHSWKNREAAFKRDKCIEHDVSGRHEACHDARANLRQNLRHGFGSFNPKNPLRFGGDIGQILFDGFQTWEESVAALHSAKQCARNEAQDVLMDYAKFVFQETAEKYEQSIISSSDALLQQADASLRKIFQDTINNSSALSSENREELREIIIGFQPSPYSVDSIFQVENFYPRFKKIFHHMNYSKIVEEFSHCLEDAVQTMNEELGKYLRDHFDSWASDLLKSLVDCLSTFSPDLHAIVEEISMRQREIDNLRKHNEELSRHKGQIAALMSWRTN